MDLIGREWKGKARESKWRSVWLGNPAQAVQADSSRLGCAGKGAGCPFNGLGLESPATFVVERFGFSCSLRFVETVDCQGFQLSRYAAELAEREGIDVGLIKRNLDLTPRERIEQSQQAADFVRQLREAGKRMRNEE
jgi:hypothetical protein